MQYSLRSYKIQVSFIPEAKVLSFVFMIGSDTGSRGSYGASNPRSSERPEINTIPIKEKTEMVSRLK